MAKVSRRRRRKAALCFCWSDWPSLVLLLLRVALLLVLLFLSAPVVSLGTFFGSDSSVPWREAAQGPYERPCTDRRIRKTHLALGPPPFDTYTQHMHLHETRAHVYIHTYIYMCKTNTKETVSELRTYIYVYVGKVVRRVQVSGGRGREEIRILGV